MTYSFLPPLAGEVARESAPAGASIGFLRASPRPPCGRSPSPHFVRGQILDCSVAIAPRNEEVDTTSFIAL
jgi:hypothetical protein